MENIYVAVAFHAPETNERKFICMDNLSRLFVFDDELNRQYTKEFIKGIKHDWLENEAYENLNEYTRYFVNEYYFGRVTTTNAEDFSSTCVEIAKILLHNGNQPENRLSKQERKEKIQTYIPIEEIKLDHKIKGKYNDDMQFNYTIQDAQKQQYSIKQLSEHTNIGHCRNLRMFIEDNEKEKIIIVIAKELLDKPFAKYLQETLVTRKNVKIIEDMDEVMNLIMKW
ncbi:MAG: hypothetical protein ACRCWQ_04570 [Bacilli bacterium]